MAMELTLHRMRGCYCFSIRAILVLLLAEGCSAGYTRLTAEREWKIFTSEDYPFRYRSNTFDTFVIRSTHPRDVIAISVEVMKLESEQPPCTNDYVDFYDGSDVNSTFLKRLCTLHTDCFASSNRTMFIVFRSDQYREGHGFKIRYRSSDRNDICPTPSLPFKWIGQLVGVVVSIIALCALWEYFKKKNGRDRMTDRCSKLSDFASNKLHSCQNNCSCLKNRIRSVFSRGNLPEPSRVTPEIVTLSNGRVTGSTNTGSSQVRVAVYGVTSFHNEAFDDSEISVSPPPYPCDYTTDPPPYEVCVSFDPHIDAQLPPYSVSQSERGYDVTTQTNDVTMRTNDVTMRTNDVTMRTNDVPPPPSYDHVILNPSNYKCDS